MTSSVTGVAYAGLVTRAIALVIDVLVIDAVALVVGGAAALVESVFSLGHGNQAVVAIVGIALFVLWVMSYFGVFWTTTGQTPGSRLMQIQVAQSNGSRLRPTRALVRLAGMFVSMPLFWGYLPILWNPRRRGVCDLMAGTVVTAVPPPASAEPALPARMTSYSGQGERARQHGATAGARSNRHLAAERGQTVA